MPILNPATFDGLEANISFKTASIGKVVHITKRIATSANETKYLNYIIIPLSKERGNDSSMSLILILIRGF